MEVSPLDSFKHLFNEKPFIFYSPKIKLVKDDIYEIYHEIISEYFYNIVVILKNNVNEFINSEKLFYYITGPEGTGKSLSLLYYSSLSKHKFLYLNTKLYDKEKNDDKFRNLFYSDIQKLFLFNYPIEDIDNINSDYQSYIKCLEKYVTFKATQT